MRFIAEGPVFAFVNCFHYMCEYVVQQKDIYVVKEKRLGNIEFCYKI
jgi:hypothetical protein